MYATRAARDCLFPTHTSNEKGEYSDCRKIAVAIFLQSKKYTHISLCYGNDLIPVSVPFFLNVGKDYISVHITRSQEVELGQI